MNATVITSASDVIVTTHPDVLLFARECFSPELTTFEETEITTGINVSCVVIGSGFHAKIKFGPKPKHVISVDGIVSYQENFVGIHIKKCQHLHYILQQKSSAINRISDILTEHINYYHKPEIHEYFATR